MEIRGKKKEINKKHIKVTWQWSEVASSVPTKLYFGRLHKLSSSPTISVSHDLFLRKQPESPPLFRQMPRIAQQWDNSPTGAGEADRNP